MNSKRDLLQHNTIDFQEIRLSKFINLKNNNISKTAKKQKDESLYLTAEAMKIFKNTKYPLKPQNSYRWENVKNMADYVELGNLTKKNIFTHNKSSRNNKENLSQWDSLMNKSENDMRLSSRRVTGYHSQERIKLLLNPNLDTSTHYEKSGKKLCSSRNKNGSIGSIKTFMDNTPELKIKITPYSKKLNEGTDFLSPSWNIEPLTIKNQFKDIEKMRVTKTYAGLAAPKKTEMSYFEVLRYVQKQKEMYNYTSGKPIEFMVNLDNKNMSITNKPTSFDKLSRNKSNKSGFSNSTGVTRDTRTAKSLMAKTIDY